MKTYVVHFKGFKYIVCADSFVINEQSVWFKTGHEVVAYFYEFECFFLKEELE